MPTKGITSPEGILMLCVAALLDVSGFIIFILGTWFGMDDYGILEVIGIAIIGLWMLMRYGPMGNTFEKVKEDRAQMKTAWEGPAGTKKGKIKEWMNPKDIAKDQAKQLALKALKRFGLNFLAELIPFLGGFWPGWTIIVWKEMKD